MRKLTLGSAVFMLGTVLCSSVQAQATKDTTKAAQKVAPGASEVRYFASLGDILGDLPVDAFIKETRQGGKIVSAVFDVCYSVSPTSDRKDRFVIDLKSDGDKLVGTGLSFEGKTPVTVNLVRKTANKAITFDGKITVGTTTALVSSPDNADIDEKEFLQTQVVDDDLIVAPKDFTQVSPQSVAIRVKREAFVDLVKTLKSENVQIALDSIATDCNALRTGQQVLRLIVDPSRAVSLIAKMKTISGVVASGWTTGTYDMERAVRFSASGWSNAGRLDRDKFANVLSTTVAKIMAAKPTATKWNDTTGEFTFAIQRPSQLAPELSLTETLEMTALISAERPGAEDRLIVWIGIPSSRTTDESAGPRLLFTENSGGEEESTFNDDDGIIKALATELKGQRWDTDKSSWK